MKCSMHWVATLVKTCSLWKSLRVLNPSIIAPTIFYINVVWCYSTCKGQPRYQFKDQSTTNHHFPSILCSRNTLHCGCRNGWLPSWLGLPTGHNNGWWTSDGPGLPPDKVRLVGIIDTDSFNTTLAYQADPGGRGISISCVRVINPPKSGIIVCTCVGGFGWGLGEIKGSQILSSLALSHFSRWLAARSREKINTPSCKCGISVIWSYACIFIAGS